MWLHNPHPLLEDPDDRGMTRGGGTPFARKLLLPRLTGAAFRLCGARGAKQGLLDRYGILFRELTAHEVPAFQWANVFRTLRLMELSRE